MVRGANAPKFEWKKFQVPSPDQVYARGTPLTICKLFITAKKYH